MDFPAPAEGIIITHFVVAANVAASADFYGRVLGGRTVKEGPPSINEDGGPTDDKPGVVLDVPDNPNRVSAFLNIRVANIQQVYADWSKGGATFLTPPIDRGAEIRCHVRDPDGHLIEVGQAIGVLESG